MRAAIVTNIKSRQKILARSIVTAIAMGIELHLTVNPITQKELPIP